MFEQKDESKKVKINAIPYCHKHPNCCYEKGCPAEFHHNPSTGKGYYKKCGC